MKKDENSIIKFNVKCAKFLGGTYRRIEELSFEPKGRWHIEALPDALQDYDLKFHSDWTQIHIILSKIKEIKTNANDYFLTELLHYTRNNNNIFDIDILASKENVCRYISEFIDWYNECKANSIV